MATFHERRHLPYACRQLFSLVADVEHYPAFLPGWQEVRVMDADERHKHVWQKFGLGPLSFDFESFAELDPPRNIQVHSTDDPFQVLTIDWQFHAVGKQTSEVTLDITVELRPMMFQEHLESWFSKSTTLIFSAFERRAAELYAHSAHPLT